MAILRAGRRVLRPVELPGSLEAGQQWVYDLAEGRQSYRINEAVDAGTLRISSHQRDGALEEIRARVAQGRLQLLGIRLGYPRHGTDGIAVDTVIG